MSSNAPGDSFAVLLSGDGGWAGLDKDVGEALKMHGIPVVGIDSLRYFWGKRTPDGLAQDVDRIIRYYAQRWHRHHVLLIGYSQGANVLPFAYNRLRSEEHTSELQSLMRISYAVFCLKNK